MKLLCQSRRAGSWTGIDVFPSGCCALAVTLTASRHSSRVWFGSWLPLRRTTMNKACPLVTTERLLWFWPSPLVQATQPRVAWVTTSRVFHRPFHGSQRGDRHIWRVRSACHTELPRQPRATAVDNCSCLLVFALRLHRRATSMWVAPAPRSSIGCMRDVMAASSCFESKTPTSSDRRRTWSRASWMGCVGWA